MTLDASASALDTRRFGRRICRATVETAADVAALEALAAREGIEMVIARTITANTKAVHALEASGHRLMDALVYWGGSLADAAPMPDGVRLATIADRATLGALAREGFTTYAGGHYHEDERLDPALVTAGYVEWCETSLDKADHEVWVTEDDAGALTGFLSLRRGEPADMVLNAVAERARGRGVYRRLVQAAMASARAHGSRDIVVSTHLLNVTPQRVWARAGLLPKHSLYTFHKWYAP